MSNKPGTNPKVPAKKRTTANSNPLPPGRSERQTAGQGSGKIEPDILPVILEKSKSALHNLKRFGWDLLGTFLALLTVLTLLGLLGLSRGTLINSWIQFLRHAFGYGSYMLMILLAWLSLLSFRQSAGKGLPVSFGKLMAIEVLLITIFPMLAFIGGVSVERSTEGLDGGVFGWGLAQFLIPFFTRIGTFLFYLILFLVLLVYLGGGYRRVAGALASFFHQFLLSSPRKNKPAQKNMERGKENQVIPAKAATPRIAETGTAKTDNIPEPEPGPGSLLPPLNLLMEEKIVPPDQDLIKRNALIIEQKLAEFGVPVRVIGFRVGPTVTQYAVEPGYTERIATDGSVTRQKVKVSRISSLSRDLALALSAQRLRIETPVPGKSYVGIEVPNEDNAFVRLKPVLQSEQYQSNLTPLSVALGRDVSGDPVKTDLEKLPHLLIAGTTNSGKSVCVTALMTSLVMNNSPRDLRLVMLDPKMVELVRFNGLPHLLGKVETELERMLAVLRWAQMEMDLRYRLLAEVRARNLAGYNQKMRQKRKPPLPRIVIVIDELADLMMSAPDQTEHSLIRLAQMARATGIHMVVATQRPSTDVITGLIKANFPARISFAMASSIDSRVILDANGAENLLGRGDMLFLDPAKSGLLRLQGVIVSDSEIEKILKHWQNIPHMVEAQPAPWEELVEEVGSSDNDALLDQAIEVVRAVGKASTSLLQRRLRIGFPRAARLMDDLEEMGVIGPAVGSGKEREVLSGTEEEADDIDDDYDVNR